MKIFTAAMLTETNTFSACPGGMPAFEEYGIYRGNGSLHPEKSLFGPLLGLWKALGQEQGHEVVESLCVFAQPAGITPRGVYEQFRSIILDDLAAESGVDIVLLALHGAMVADGYDDCEGDLLGRVREIIGPDIVVGVVVDPHCHLSAAMLEYASILIAYKEYPHTDVADRSVELFQLCLRAAAGDIRPVIRAYDCNMVGLWRTLQEPTRSLVSEMKDLEGRDGVLSVSFGHGFPWADVRDAGARTWAITDGDVRKAAELARQLGEKVIANRHRAGQQYLSMDEAIDALNAAPPGLIAIADMADNPGGGGMSDSTFMLHRFTERGVTGAVLGLFWDLGAIDICRNAGVGATVDLRIGGKCSPLSGNPVDLRCTITEIRENHLQSGLGGGKTTVGTAVWVAAGGLDIVFSSIRSQVYSPDVFTGLGIELNKRRAVVVKSLEHFAAGFKDIAAKVLYVDTPGALSQDFANILYSKREGNYWPRVEPPVGKPFP